MTRFDGRLQNAKQKQHSKPDSSQKKTKSQSDMQASGHLDSNPSSKMERSPKGKSSNSQYLRTTLYLSKALHKRLKMGALEHDMEMSDIAEAAISEWLDNHS